MKIGYARVSTEEQNIELQRQALKSVGCDIIYEDRGISGASTERHGLLEALERIGEDDILVVWKLDRLGRSLAHFINLIDQIGKAGAGFQCLTEAIDTTTTGGTLVFHMMGALAEFERSLIAERTRAGIIDNKPGTGKLYSPLVNLELLKCQPYCSVFVCRIFQFNDHQRKAIDQKDYTQAVVDIIFNDDKKSRSCIGSPAFQGVLWQTFRWGIR